MNNLVRFDPFREFETLSSRLARMFNEPNADVSGEQFFAPSVDISESNEAFHFRADLPDVKKEDIKITLENRLLTLSGTKKHEQETRNDDRKYHRVERSWGSFTRSFQLPDNVDAERVEAKYDNGVLDVKVGKRTNGGNKTTQIQVK